MSLITCPECANEVSAAAAACPNCGHPFAVRPPVQPRVVVQEFVEEDSGFPKWAFIPLGLLGVVLLFVLFAFLRNGNDDDQRNINVRIAGQTNGNTTRETIVPSTAQPNQVVVPSTSQPNQVVIPPSTTTTTTTLPSTTTTVPATQTALPPDKGTIVLEAKVLARNSSAPQPVRGTRFYLLKKDAESVLDSANIDNDTGQSLLTALGISMVDSARFGDIKSKAMSAIGKNAAYNFTTDSSGKASLKDVKPDNYYLFAVTRSGNGYIVWNQSVTIQAGQNSLVLSPASPTEVTQQEEEEE